MSESKAFNEKYCDSKCALDSCSKSISTATHLDLSNCGLQEIPAVIQEAVKLQSLNINRNEISRLKGVEGLSNLRVLEANNNWIKDLGDLKNLPKLEVLSLGANRLKQLQEMDLVDKKKAVLTHLDLSANSLEKIENLNEHRALEALHLGNNRISRIEHLSALKNLEYLRLNDNEIVEIEGLEQLTSLERLDLRYNEIERVQGLYSLRNLARLDLDGNPLKGRKDEKLLEQLLGSSVEERRRNSFQMARKAVELSRRRQLSSWGRVKETIKDWF